MQISSIFLCMFFSLSMLVKICHSRDTITKASPLNDHETIISASTIFEFGSFNPDSDASNRYAGIWYYQLQSRVVWVAILPLSSSLQSYVSIGEDGNLKVLGSNTTAKLLDSGNLVLIDDKSGKYLWQGFENPTDTFLPGMLMTANLVLTSWGDKGIPELGSYTFKLDEEANLYVIMKDEEVYWKSGEPSSSKMPVLVRSLLTDSRNLTATITNNRTRTISYSINSSVERLVLDSSGVLQYYQNIDLLWQEPLSQCSMYNACGDYGICKDTNEKRKECKCLEGFNPRASDQWQSGEYKDGCTRKRKLCDGASGEDKFYNLSSVKLAPTKIIHSEFYYAENCSKSCLEDCQCQAYSFVGANGRNANPECKIWKKDLRDLQEGVSGGINLSVRIPVYELNSPSQPEVNSTITEERRSDDSHVTQKVLIIHIVVIATFVICILSYIFYRKKIASNHRARTSTGNNGSLQPTMLITESHASDTTEGNKRKSIDVSFFTFKTILVATDNFSEANKLGEGGFGPVYKGVFADKQYLAVKRLSSSSGQGVEEFQNEVALIAKLQHRNLVRVLGYCVEKDERVLLYEYMPNKSLDKFIFNEQLAYLLDWRKRFDIISGVARGLLYLHQDSRLRIIHRDLKTSNILLDEEMNPKISDFGLARIVQGIQTEVNTGRVAGTYGYMSPEYALEGLFSIKSDVFSFGVIILEIISGKRNTGFHQSGEALNLLGYVWKLWEAKNPLDLLDEALEGDCNETEVSKCINIGLLCVQEDPGDRPNMANVVTMLSSETVHIPTPSQPAFIERRSQPSTSSSSSIYREAPSFNKLTVTMQEGR